MKINAFKLTNSGENPVDVFSTAASGQVFTISLNPGETIGLEAPVHPDIQVVVNSDIEKDES